MKGIATYKEGIDFVPNKYNFIYGPNGTGKSTLSKVLNSDNNEEGINVERDTINNERVVVYNKKFVETNFKQDKGIKGIFTLGKDSVDKHKTIDAKQDDISKLNGLLERNRTTIDEKKRELNELKHKIEQKCWDSKQDCFELFPNVFNGFKRKTTYFEKCMDEWKKQTDHFSVKKADLIEMYQTAFDSNNVPDETYSNINIDSICSFDNNILLAEEITGKKDSQISVFVDYLNASDWVHSGLLLLGKSNGKCPFCNRELPETIRTDLENYFDETYSLKKEKINQYYKDYITVEKCINQVFDDIEKKHLSYIDYTLYNLKKEALTEKLKNNCEKISYKINNLSEIVTIDSIMPLVNDISTEIISFNKKIQEHNSFINNADAKKNVKIKVWEYAINLCLDALATYHSQKNPLEKANESLMQKVDEINEKVKRLKYEIQEIEKSIVSVQPAADAINDILQGFGFLGFRIEIDTTHKGMYQITRPNGEAAHDTLSEGEHNFISFLYFYYLCLGSQEKTGIIGDKILVIDDPISSMDSNVMFIVSTLVKQILFKCKKNEDGIKQIFVLTHNTYFFKEITFWGRKNQLASQETSYWVLNKKDENTQIIKYDSNPIKTTYELLWNELKQQKLHSISYRLNIMRRILEHYFALLGGIDYERCINDFVGTDKLVCKALVSFINDGSHSIFEDYIYTPTNQDIECYDKVFRLIFEKMGQKEHYKMMMGDISGNS